MNKNIKSIIVINNQWANDWMRANNKKFNGRIVSAPEQARGIDFKEDNTLIMIGKDYDYPESNPHLTRIKKNNFYKLLDVVNRRIELNKNIERN